MLREVQKIMAKQREEKLAHDKLEKELELREGIIKKVRKLSDKDLKTSEDTAKAITRRNPWTVHKCLLGNKGQIVTYFKSHGRNIAVTGRYFNIPPNTLRGNLIAWGIHKPEGKQITYTGGNTRLELLGESKEVRTYLWADDDNDKILPCEMPCPKCGTTDIHRLFKVAGSKASLLLSLSHTSNEFVKRDKYETKVLKDCIMHHCRCCQYDWETEALK